MLQTPTYRLPGLQLQLPCRHRHPIGKCHCLCHLSVPPHPRPQLLCRCRKRQQRIMNRSAANHVASVITRFHFKLAIGKVVRCGASDRPCREQFNLSTGCQIVSNPGTNRRIVFVLSAAKRFPLKLLPYTAYALFKSARNLDASRYKFARCPAVSLIF